MQQRNGISIGQRVRDLDGNLLGRVVRLFEEGFEVRRGLPILWHREAVVRYDEVRGARDGAVVVARSGRDLLELATGGIPPSWRIPAPTEYPTAATPWEARELVQDIARGLAGGGSAPAEPRAAAGPATDEEPGEVARGRAPAEPRADRAH